MNEAFLGTNMSKYCHINEKLHTYEVEKYDLAWKMPKHVFPIQQKTEKKNLQRIVKKKFLDVLIFLYKNDMKTMYIILF